MGLDLLDRLIGLLPKLRVVLLQGRHAQASWTRLARRSPDLVDNVIVLPTYHPSPQALRARTAAERQARRDQRLLTYIVVADILHRQASGDS